MLGKNTPDQIRAVRPLKDGVIADFTTTQLMLRKYYRKGRRKDIMLEDQELQQVFHQELQKLRKEQWKNLFIQAGAREVYLIEEPMAAAIGASFRGCRTNWKYYCRYWWRDNRSCCYFFRRNCSQSFFKSSRG